MQKPVDGGAHPEDRVVVHGDPLAVLAAVGLGQAVVRGDLPVVLAAVGMGQAVAGGMVHREGPVVDRPVAPAAVLPVGPVAV